MKKKKTYKFPLRLEEIHKEPLSKLAENNDSSVNTEINKAVETHIERNKKKTK